VVASDAVKLVISRSAAPATGEDPWSAGGGTGLARDSATRQASYARLTYEVRAPAGTSTACAWLRYGRSSALIPADLPTAGAPQTVYRCRTHHARRSRSALVSPACGSTRSRRATPG
jgi:hypothetical protein